MGGGGSLDAREQSSWYPLQRQFEALETAQFLTLLPGCACYLAQTRSRQSAEASPATRVLLLTRLLYFLFTQKSAATCIVTQSKDTLGDGQLNRNRFFLPDHPWSGSGRYFFPFTVWLSDRMLTGDQQGRYFLKDSIKVQRLFTDLLSIEFCTPLFYIHQFGSLALLFLMKLPKVNTSVRCTKVNVLHLLIEEYHHCGEAQPICV